MRFFPALTSLVVVLAAPLSADTLVFEDYTLGTSAIPGALAANAGLVGATTTTTDLATFQSLLNGGSWDLVIFAEQNLGGQYDIARTDIQSYLSSGGRMIGMTWFSVSDTQFDEDFEATVLNTNQTLILNDGSPFFTGVTGNIDLVNPGWGVFSIAYNPTGGGSGFAPFSGGGFAGILGNGGSTILLGPLSDTYSPLSDGQAFLGGSIQALLAPVPEPSTMGLLGLGLVGAAIRRRRAATAA